MPDHVYLSVWLPQYDELSVLQALRAALLDRKSVV